MPEMLLLSNSTNYGRSYLDHAWPAVLEFLNDCTELVFIPFAGGDHAAYTEKVRTAFETHGIQVRGLPANDSAQQVLQSAQHVFVGGGNTFRLLARLQRLDLVEVLQEQVRSGSLRYMGASAGTNIAAPTIKTTNDMPIIEPETFAALDLVPFQINPHYLDADPHSTHNGETREIRIHEFLEENDTKVLGLREGTSLRATGSGRKTRFTLGGKPATGHTSDPAVLFESNGVIREVRGDVTQELLTGVERSLPTMPQP